MPDSAEYAAEYAWTTARRLARFRGDAGPQVSVCLTDVHAAGIMIERMPTRPDKQNGTATVRSLAGALAAEGDDSDPALLALLMAGEFYADVRAEEYLRKLDGWAARAKERLGRARTPARVISAINAVLFEEEGFAGNVEEYYDPRNSFLNEVLDRKTGIPITLSVVYLAVARRLRQPFAGVGLPLHFIVKYAGAGGELFVDPFRGGQILSREECRERIEKALGSSEPKVVDGFLAPVPPRALLYRMLMNLKFIYLKRLDFESAARVVDLLLQVRPDDPDEVRDRGLLYFQVENWAGAARFLQQYLEENPEAGDADTVRVRLAAAAERRARLN